MPSQPDSQAFSLKSMELADVPVVQAGPTEAAREICRLAKSRREGQSIHLVNAYNIALAHRDAAYSHLLKSSTGNFPDGRPLTWWKLSGGRLIQVRGPQLFEDVMEMGRSMGVRHFLLGSTAETLARLEANLRARFPEVDIVGTYSPPYRAMTEAEIAVQDKAIFDSGAEIVWVGLGTPKQDWEVARLAARLPTVNVAVGAAFDFSAGTKLKAPQWVTQAGLEWLFRLLCEPRRLWKRYLLGNLVFLWAVLSCRFKSAHPSSKE